MPLWSSGYDASLSRMKQRFESFSGVLLIKRMEVLMDLSKVISSKKTLDTNFDNYKKLLRRINPDNLEEIVTRLDSLPYDLNRKRFPHCKFESDFRAYFPLDDMKEYLTKNVSKYSLDSVMEYMSSLQYFVVSYNPVDFLYCSYGDGYSSCLSLNSKYDYCWGLPSLFTDSPRYMAYLSKGKHKNKKLYDDIAFRTIDKKIRAWMFKGKDKQVKILNHYSPSNCNSSCYDALYGYFFKYANNLFKDNLVSGNFTSSTTEIELMRLANAPCYIYEDCGLVLHPDKKIHTTEYGCYKKYGWTGAGYMNSDNTSILCYLENDLDNDHFRSHLTFTPCKDCGEPVSDKEIYRGVCPQCCELKYYRCWHCGNSHKRGTETELYEHYGICNNKVTICPECIKNRKTFTCDCCSKEFFKDNTKIFVGDGKYYCKECNEEHYYNCDYCHNYTIDSLMHSTGTPDYTCLACHQKTVTIRDEVYEAARLSDGAFFADWMLDF